MKYREFIKVPESVYLDKSNYEVVLPLYLYLCTCRDRTGVCRATLTDMLLHCGYKVTTGRTTYDKFEEIKDALEYLAASNLISSITDLSGGVMGRDDIKPNNLIYIYVKDDLENAKRNQYTIVYIDDCIRLQKLCAETLGTRASFWRTLAVYMAISSRIWRRGKDDIVVGSDTQTAAQYPEYYTAHLSKISENLSDYGFSVPAIRSAIKRLSSAELIHYESAAVKVNTEDGPNIKKIGVVFVLHSDNWKVELEAAKTKSKDNYRKFYQGIINKKGELADS